VGATARVGDRCSLMQGVTLGGTGKEAGDRHPKVADGVLLGARATVLGNIRVGRYAQVAAGSLVLRPVGDGELAAGSPARSLGVRFRPGPGDGRGGAADAAPPSLTMRQWDDAAERTICEWLDGPNGPHVGLTPATSGAAAVVAAARDGRGGRDGGGDGGGGDASDGEGRTTSL